MHNRPTLNITWYEDLAWNICPWIYYKIHGIRERRAEELEKQRIFKIVKDEISRLEELC